MDTNLLTLINDFNTDEKCRDLLERLRWPDGVACLRCGDRDVTEIPSRNQYDCKACEYQFSVTTGTIMHDTHLPLYKWFITVYLMCESKKAISALQVKRTIGVAYQTAWYLCHRIREAMGNDPLEGPTLLGVVEVDETLIGGKVRGKGQGYKGNKVWVAGAIQRGGAVRLERIPNVKKPTLHDFINRTVKDEADAIYTDELASYIGIETANTPHRTVNHAAAQWVFGNVHTNSIESVWALFKRSIIGAFHHVSIKHLDRYLEELEWRFSNRENGGLFTDTLRRMVNTGPLPYEELTAA